ncbi:MAG: pirin family protein [Gemmatimonadota bacterium]|nr:MAG: pirin family protein [Gemmatimonadota bacterium]
MSIISRKVLNAIEPQYVLEGAGVRLRRGFPTEALDYLDPFLLFDDFSSNNPADYMKGFPMHPHRGIETVTYILAGEVNHRDSIGNAGKIGAGDVQWMTSGRGIMHEEMPSSRSGKLIGFQLWVNLPAQRKMNEPRYQGILSADIPEVELNDGVKVRVIAGRVGQVEGPVTGIVAEPTYLNVFIPSYSSFTHEIDEDRTAFAYVFEGEGMFEVTEGMARQFIQHRKLVVLGAGHSLVVKSKGQSIRFLLVLGKPIREPIARYGPFVMNTREEIEQALRDLRNGTFIDPQPNSDSNSWYGSPAKEK